MEQQNVLFVEGHAVKLTAEGMNLGAVRTNHPKISQLTLAAIVEKEFPDVQVKIIDLKMDNPKNEAFVRQINYGAGKIDVYRVGENFAVLEDDVKQANYVVLTNNFTQEAGNVGDLVEFCRRVNPKIQVLIGGSDASVKSLEVDRSAYFYSRGADCVAPLGDGEILLPVLLRRNRISEHKRVVTLDDLDLVPNPSLHLVNFREYTESHEGPLPDEVKGPLMYVETSRGCRQVCDFCGTPFTKGKYRFMSQVRIENLLSSLKDSGITDLLLCEDNILSRLDLQDGRKYVLNWFNWMRTNGFRWEFSNGVEIGKLAKNGDVDDELIEALFSYDRKVGCYRSYVPLERVDEQVYRKLKPFDVEKKIIHRIANRGVPLLNFGVIIGHPQETRTSLDLTETRVREVMEMVGNQRVKPYANVFLHIPIPGTRDYKRFHYEKRLAYSIDEHPELFGFYTSVVNGDNFDCHSMTKIRREIAFNLNGEEAMRTWEQTGRYDYK